MFSLSLVCVYCVEKNCHMSNSNVNSLLIKSNPSRCHQVLILAQNQKKEMWVLSWQALLVAVKITFVIITNITIFPWNVTNSNSNLELYACYHVCLWIMEFICPLTNSCWPVGTTDYGRMVLMIPDFPIDIRIRLAELKKKNCCFLTLLIFCPVGWSQQNWPS